LDATRRPKGRQRAAEPREWRVLRRDWTDIPEDTRVRVEHTEPWPTAVGELAGPIVLGGWASVNLGDVETKSRGPIWLGVRHVPYGSIKKIFVIEGS
jgi:hypothetical protein